jgi:hypothetical protein
MERKLPLFWMTEEAPSEGSRMMAELLSRDIAAQRAGHMVAPPPGGLGDLWGIPMRPDEGYIQLVSVVSWHWLFASSFFPNPSLVRRGCATRDIPQILHSLRFELRIASSQRRRRSGRMRRSGAAIGRGRTRRRGRRRTGNGRGRASRRSPRPILHRSGTPHPRV